MGGEGCIGEEYVSGIDAGGLTFEKFGCAEAMGTKSIESKYISDSFCLFLRLKKENESATELGPLNGLNSLF